MTDPAKGIFAIVFAFLAHRTLWSTILFGGILVLQGRFASLAGCFENWRTFGILALSSLMIACNWLLFIVSVQVGKVMESSFGYYVFPLVAVLLGRLVFQEKLTSVQKLCVALAALAVLLLGFGLGVTPWIAIVLATTFGTYSMLKKLLRLGPVVSVTGEVLILAPIAILWLAGLGMGWWQEAGRPPALRSMDWMTFGLLVLSGPMTATPLILFSYAAKRIALSTVGLVQYLNPTLQFICAVAVFGEAFSHWHAIAFGLIWSAVALYSWTSVQAERRARKSAMASSAEATTSTKSMTS